MCLPSSPSFIRFHTTQVAAGGAPTDLKLPNDPAAAQESEPIRVAQRMDVRDSISTTWSPASLAWPAADGT
jgi:hypothetical protein